MEQTGGFLANFGRLAGLTSIGLIISLWGREAEPSAPYVPANCNRGELTVFPHEGQALVIPLPPGLRCVGFSPDGKSVLATDGAKPTPKPRGWLRIEFNPTRVSAADSAVSMQGNRSPDGKWVADLEDRRQRLVIRDAHDPTQTRIFGHGGMMKPTWSPDSRYLVLEKWQLRCGLNFDVEVPETLEILDTKTRKRSVVRSSRCKVQFGVNGFVSSDITR
jgi:WD40-like Beta Propeller Repeat